MMEFYKVTLGFLSAVIPSLAWPILIGAFLFLSRKFIQNTISRVIRVKYKDIEMDLRDEMASLKEKAALAGVDTRTPLFPDWKQRHITYLETAKGYLLKNTNVAMSNAMLALRSFTEKLVEKLAPECSQLYFDKLVALEKSELISPQMLELLKRLNHVGYEAMDTGLRGEKQLKEISYEEAAAYVVLVEETIKKLEPMLEKPQEEADISTTNP